MARELFLAGTVTVDSDPIDHCDWCKKELNRDDVVYRIENENPFSDAPDPDSLYCEVCWEE